MATARAVPLLICSIGNPGSTYANTLHSAGHTVLNRLADHLGYSNFRKERSMGNGLVSTGGDGTWTLWQSTSYMNTSGKGVRDAYKAWSSSLPVGEKGRLVVVYDELEKPLAKVTLRTTQGSARGHNGLKDIQTFSANLSEWARIGVGIGRPLSRESDDVARYVLKKMSPEEKTKIEGSVQDVISMLQKIPPPET